MPGKSFRVLLGACVCFGAARIGLGAPEAEDGAKAECRWQGPYAVLVSRATWNDPAWREVVRALEGKHGATRIVYEEAVDAPDVLERLRRLFPRYACLVARPEEAGRPFVVAVHRLLRRLDDDPYTDCFWGILTGYDAETALRIARTVKPLVCRRALGGTSVPVGVFEAVRWYSEGHRGVMWEKTPGGAAVRKECPPDTTSALVEDLNRWKPDVFVTSGHATERDWQIGFSYKNGQFRCRKGRVVGIDLEGRVFPVDSPNPKVYLPAGNCLMGRIPDRECMALAFMKSAGVTQMIGYVVSTWYGWGGWGVLEYFFHEPGEFSLTEAFFANQHALIHELQSRFPEVAGAGFEEFGIEKDRRLLSRFARKHGVSSRDALGLLWDRDTVAFYGDPAWEARLAPGPAHWRASFAAEGKGVYVVTVEGVRSAALKRPPVVFFPCRLSGVKVIAGEEFAPAVADDFILFANLKSVEAGKAYRVRFRAGRVQAAP